MYVGNVYRCVLRNAPFHYICDFVCYVMFVIPLGLLLHLDRRNRCFGIYRPLAPRFTKYIDCIMYEVVRVKVGLVLSWPLGDMPDSAQCRFSPPTDNDWWPFHLVVDRSHAVRYVLGKSPLLIYVFICNREIFPVVIQYY